MKPWPTLAQFAFPSPASAGATHYFVAYERASAEAALERLRVAVDGLQKAYEKHVMGRGNSWEAPISEALEAIGPLPDGDK